jgi:hypothetical protein
MTNYLKYIILAALALCLLLVPIQVSFAQVSLDTDLDGLVDTLEDINSNGTVDPNETNPQDPDTDSDGYSDGLELNSNPKTNPLDPNSLPNIPAKEQDLNGDGVIDKTFTDAQMQTQFGITVVSDINISTTAKCLKDNLTIFIDNATCSWPLTGDSNNYYSIINRNYKSRISNSLDEGKCYIENNKTPQSILTCTNIPTKNATLGVNEIELISNNSKLRTTNLTFVLDKNAGTIYELTQLIDAQIPRTCTPANASSTTECTFNLPKNTILPPTYQMGMSQKLSGTCVQIQSTSEVKCSGIKVEIPFTTRSMITSLNSKIEANILIQPETDLKDDSNFTQLNVNIRSGDTFPIISGLTNNYQGPAQIIINADNTPLIIYGIIDLSGNFTPSEPTLVNIPNNTYSTFIISNGPNYIGTYLKQPILITISNSPTKLYPSKTLTRTGASNNNINPGLLTIGLILLILGITTTKQQQKLILLITISTLSLSAISVHALELSKIYPDTAKIDPKLKSFSCQRYEIRVTDALTCIFKLNAPIQTFKIGETFKLWILDSSPDDNQVLCLNYAQDLMTFVCENIYIPKPNKPNETYPLIIKEVREERNIIYSTGKNIKVLTPDPTKVENMTIMNMTSSAISTVKVKDQIQVKINDTRYPTRKGYKLLVTDSITTEKVAVFDAYKSSASGESDEYTATFKLPKGGYYVFTACVILDKQLNNFLPDCTLTNNTQLFAALEDLVFEPATGVAGSINPKKDKLNVVFGCEKSIKDMNVCRNTVRTWLNTDKDFFNINPSGTLSPTITKETSPIFGLLQTEPYKSNKDKIQFLLANQLLTAFDGDWHIEDTLLAGYNPKTTIFIAIKAKQDRSFAFIPGFAYKSNLVKNDIDYSTYDNDDIVENGYITVNMLIGNNNNMDNQHIGVLTHEMGHAMFGLRDEYYEIGNTEPRLGFPNCLDPLTARDQLTKFMGTANLEGITDPYYASTTATLAKYKSPLDPKTSYLDYLRKGNSYLEKDFKLTLNAKGFCFGPVNGKVQRPTNDSIMKGSTPFFGPVNAKRANQVLSQFTGQDILNCTNGAQNYPSCDDWLVLRSALCPVGSAYDYGFGFCVSSTEAYGPFPKAMVDRCVALYNQPWCTATKSVDVDKYKFNLNVYPKDKIINLRGSAYCAFGTALLKGSKNNEFYCTEKAANSLTKEDMIYGQPMLKDAVNKCIKFGLGSSCFLQRYNKSLFDKVNI